MSDVIAKVYKDKTKVKFLEEIDDKVLSIKKADPIISDGLVGWWPLSGDTRDISGNENDGTNNGATPSIGYDDSSCYSFDGIANYVSTTFNGTEYSELTISFWLKANNIENGFQYILDNSPSSTGYMVRLSTNTLGFYMYSDISLLNVSTIVPDNDWHFYTFSFSSTINKASIDGVISYVLAHDTAAPILIGTKMILGSVYTKSGDYLDGKIQDVKIYNRALSEEEITQLYKAGPTKSNYNLGISNIREKPELVSGDNKYFPLDDKADSNEILDIDIVHPVVANNLVFDEEGLWLGTSVTNLWGNKTGNFGWQLGDISTKKTSFYQGATKQILSQSSSVSYQNTLNNNSFTSGPGYYTVSAYYRQLEGPSYINPTGFILTNSSGTSISKESYSEHISPMKNVYQKGWVTANYLVETTSYPFIEWRSDSSQAKGSFTALMTENNYFTSPWCENTRGAGELTYNLHRDAGINWNEDYTIMYWKKPHGTDSRSKSSGYNAESVGDTASNRIWFGRNQTDNKYYLNGTAGSVISNYQYNWFLHVLRRVGTNLVLQVFSKESSTPVVNITIDNSQVNSSDYYVYNNSDFRLSGRANGYSNNSYYKDLQVITRSLTDEEILKYFNTKLKVYEDKINTGDIKEGVL